MRLLTQVLFHGRVPCQAGACARDARPQPWERPPFFLRPAGRRSYSTLATASLASAVDVITSHRDRGSGSGHKGDGLTRGVMPVRTVSRAAGVAYR